jgi:hypothetical protein
MVGRSVGWSVESLSHPGRATTFGHFSIPHLQMMLWGPEGLKLVNN